MDERAPDEVALSLVADAEDRFDAGEFARALEDADAALGRAPRLVRAISVKAAALEALERPDSAAAAHESALRLAPQDVDVFADAAEFYLRCGMEAGDEHLLERARDLARAGARLAAASSTEVVSDFLMIESDALIELGAPRQALARIEEAIRGSPTDDRLALERGLLLYELGQAGEAKRLLEAVLRSDPRNATALHTMGLIAERSGEAAEAAARFRQAHRESPEGFPIPVRLSQQEFDAAIEDALNELPVQIRDYLSNVAIAVEDLPADDDLLASEPPLSPSILGMFRGTSVGEKASMDPWSHFPSSIVLYQKNLERFATDRKDLVEQVRVTLLHEVGHFLGLDEEQLRDRGLD